MKRSGNQWNIDDIKHVFKKRFAALRGKRTGDYRNKFAVIWYVDAPQRMTNRVVDEDELDYLLQNRFFTQYVAAVQLYFGGYPLKGSGWFEHRVWTDDKDKEYHQTSELILPPPQPEYLDLNKFVSGVNGIIERGPEPVADTRPPPRLHITEAQHEYLKPVASKLLRYIRTYSHCKVVDATFIFGFNSTWAPFVMGVSGVQLREVPQSVQLMRAKMFSSFDSMFTRDMQIKPGEVKAPTQILPTTSSTPAAQPHVHKPPHLKNISRLDSMDVIPIFNHGQAAEPPIIEEFAGDPTDPSNIPKPNMALLRSGSAGAGSNVDFGRREEVPATVAGTKLGIGLPAGSAPQPNPVVMVPIPSAPAGMAPSSPTAKRSDPRAVGSGGNQILSQKTSAAPESILQDYALAYGIGFRTDQTAAADIQHGDRHRNARANIMKDLESERNRGTLSSTVVTSKTQGKFEEGKEAKHRYEMITDTWSRRVKAYPSQVRGSQDESWDEFKRTLRPLSAPMSPGQTMLARSMSG